MIVSYLDLISVSTLPPKADSILLVDRDGPPPLPVIHQRMKFVARRGSKIAVMASLVDVVEFLVAVTPGNCEAYLYDDIIDLDSGLPGYRIT